jgi:hypothetical protein
VNCDGFDQENYALYSAGSLEGAEAGEIERHLAQDCETCAREMRRGIAFWNGFGSALSPDFGEPRTRPWMNVASVAEKTSGEQSRAASWPRWAAVAAVLVGAVGATFWFVSLHDARARSHAETELAELRSRTQELSRERDQALASARQRDAAPQPQTPQAKAVAGPTPKEFEQLEQTLSGARRNFQQAQESLVSARAQATRLQEQLNQQQTELAEAQSQRSQLSARLSAGNANQQNAARRVQLLQTQVAQLENDKTRLLNMVETRQRQTEQTLRTISYLSTPGTRLIELQGTQSAQTARGYALIGRDNRLMFYQAGLPALPAGRTYQIWLIRDRGEPVVSGGLFAAGPRSSSQSEYNEGDLTAGLRAVAVTEEPAGGSKLPTGHKLLLGTVHS